MRDQPNDPFQGMFPNPMIIERTPQGDRAYDIYSRLMKDRIIVLGTEVTDFVSNMIIGQLLFLNGVDPDADIQLYIQSPGGSVSAGLAIHDTMKFIRAPVSTICMGTAASMGAFLLSAGTKGKRYVLPNAYVMIHQPRGGTMGTITDMKIQVEHGDDLKRRLARLMAEYTGQPYETVYADTERDNYMDAEQSVAYGIADAIMPSQRPPPPTAGVPPPVTGTSPITNS